MNSETWKLKIPLKIIFFLGTYVGVVQDNLPKRN